MNIKITWEKVLALITLLGMFATFVVKVTHAEDGIAQNAKNHLQHVERTKEGKGELKQEITKVSGTVEKNSDKLSTVLQQNAAMDAQLKSILTAIDGKKIRGL